MPWDIRRHKLIDLYVHIMINDFLTASHDPYHDGKAVCIIHKYKDSVSSKVPEWGSRMRVPSEEQATAD